MPIMMAGVEDPATLSGLRQPMAIAMVRGVRPSRRAQQGDRFGIVECRQSLEGSEEYRSMGKSPRGLVVDHLQSHQPWSVVAKAVDQKVTVQLVRCALWCS